MKYVGVSGTFLGLVVGVFFGWALVLAGLAGVVAAILLSRRAAKLNILRAIVTE